MTTPIEAGEEFAELVKTLSSHLGEDFEQAEAAIKELSELSPGLPALLRLGIAGGTSWRIQREFAFGVLEISRQAIGPPPRMERSTTAAINFGRFTPEQGQVPRATSRLAANGWGKTEAICRKR